LCIIYKTCEGCEGCEGTFQVYGKKRKKKKKKFFFSVENLKVYPSQHSQITIYIPNLPFYMKNSNKIKIQIQIYNNYNILYINMEML